MVFCRMLSFAGNESTEFNKNNWRRYIYFKYVFGIYQFAQWDYSII